MILPPHYVFSARHGPQTGARNDAPPSVQAVKAERPAGHHAVLRRRRQADKLLPDHVGRAREEAIWVRIVGCPQDLIGTDIVGQHPEAALDRLEGDPAIALEQFAWPGRQAGIVEALIVEMPVHPVEPWRDPAAARLEETDPDLRVLLAHAAPDHCQAG